MRNILEHSISFMMILYSSACYAAEKLEVLPELPSHSSISDVVADTSSLMNETSLIGFLTQNLTCELFIVTCILFFIGIVALTAGILHLNNNSNRKQNDILNSSKISLLSTANLGGNKSLHVIELDGKKMLIGASSNVIQLLKDLDTNSEEDNFETDFSDIMSSEKNNTEKSHTVNPDDYDLYKKYLV